MAPFSSDVTAGQDVYAGDLNNLRKDLMTGVRIIQTVSPTTITTLDLSATANGAVKQITLDKNITLRFSGVTKYPTLFFVRFKQNGTGGFTITVDQTGMAFPGGAAVVISSGANEATGLMFVAYSTTDWECYYAGFGMKVPA